MTSIFRTKSSYTKHIDLIIDNIPLRVKEYTTILQACESIGISLPRFCYHKFLSIAGNCRMCLVQVEKSMKPMVSCSIPVIKDMKIFTITSVVKKARENVLEMLLNNHPLDCPICDQGGECDLQQNSLKYGNDRTRFFFKKRGVENLIFNPLIKTVMTRCFHCTRCVRYASELAGTTVLGTIGRGKVTEVSTFISNNFTSLFSGNLGDLCPVGALTTNSKAFSSRKWERTLTNSIDILDGLGSTINVNTIRNEVIRISSAYNSEINKYGISDKARYSYDNLIKLRLIKILKKLKGSNNYRTISWKKALTIIQKKILSLEGFEIGVIYGPFSDLKTIYNAKYFFNKKGSSNIGTEYEVKKNNDSNNATAWYNLINYDFLNKVSTYTRPLIDFDSSFKLNTNISGLEKADFCLLIGINPDTEATALTPRLHLMNINTNVHLCYIGIKIHSNLLIDILGVSINKILKKILQGKHKINTNLITKYNNPVFLLGSLLSIRSDSYILNKNIKKISKILEKFPKNKQILTIKQNLIFSSKKKIYYNVVFSFPKKIINIINYSASITGGLELGIIPGKTSLFNDVSIFNTKLLYLLNTSITTTTKVNFPSFFNTKKTNSFKHFYQLSKKRVKDIKDQIIKETGLKYKRITDENYNTAKLMPCYLNGTEREGLLWFVSNSNYGKYVTFVEKAKKDLDALKEKDKECLPLEILLRITQSKPVTNFIYYRLCCSLVCLGESIQPLKIKMKKLVLLKNKHKRMKRKNKHKSIKRKFYIYCLYTKFKAKNALFIIYQGHHLRIEKNKYKPDLILPSSVYTEKNSSTYMNVEGKVQLVEKLTSKRSIFIKDDCQILKSLLNFSAINCSNKALKFYSDINKNLEIFYLDYFQDNFENILKPFYHFYNDIIIKLFILNDFKNSMCYYSTVLKTYTTGFKRTIYEKC